MISVREELEEAIESARAKGMVVSYVLISQNAVEDLRVKTAKLLGLNFVACPFLMKNEYALVFRSLRP